MPGQCQTDGDTTWQRRVAIGPTLARSLMLAGIHITVLSIFSFIYPAKKVLDMRLGGFYGITPDQIMLQKYFYTT